MSKADELRSKLVKDVATLIKQKNELEKASQDVAQERDQNTTTFDKLRSDLREASRQNAELKDFIADYKQQVEEMEERLNKMAEQRKKQKETIDSLMEENLELKKQLAGKSANKDDADEET
jgi:chromosome segregation ATPase